MSLGVSKPRGNRLNNSPKFLHQYICNKQRDSEKLLQSFQNKWCQSMRILNISKKMYCLIMCIYVWVPCRDVRYDFHINTMFGSSLPPVVCRRDHVLFVGGIMSCLHCLCLFVGGIMSCLHCLCLFVGGIMSCLHCLCLFVGGLMSCLHCLCLFVGGIMSCLHCLCLFVGGIMSCLHCLCLFPYSGVQHILHSVFVLFLLVLCSLYCQFFWIIHFWLSLRYSLPCIYSLCYNF